MKAVPKTVAALVAGVVVGGASVHLFQEGKRESLQTGIQERAKRQEESRTKTAAGLTTAQVSEDELERLQKGETELLRLRNEVTRLRRELDGIPKATSGPPPQSTNIIRSAENTDAEFIARQSLSNVGYGTPLTAMRTITWANMSGNYEQVLEAMSPEMRKGADTPEARQQFEAVAQEDKNLFEGMQVLAQKNVSADKVELKVRYFVAPRPSGAPSGPQIAIQPLVRVGEDWKWGGNTGRYSESWDRNGDVFLYNHRP
jgi:hypothetical protein